MATAGWATRSVFDRYDIKAVEDQADGLRRTQAQEAKLMASLQSCYSEAENEQKEDEVAERPALQ